MRKRTPVHFLWSAGLHTGLCPYCRKSIKLKRLKTFVLAFTAVTLSRVPAQILAGMGIQIWLALITIVVLLEALALMVLAVSSGFREQRDGTALNQQRPRSNFALPV